MNEFNLSFIVKIVIGFIVIFHLQHSFAEDLYELTSPMPIMSKKYNLNKEIDFNVGYFPMNSFSKYSTMGASFSIFFGEKKEIKIHGWEIINFMQFTESPSSLKKILLNSESGFKKPDGTPPTPSDFPVCQTIFLTNYLYSPLYTKSLLFNSNMVYSQILFPIGIGVAKFSTESIIIYDFGAILKFFMFENSALNFDFRYIGFVSNHPLIKGNFLTSLGYTWSF